MSSPSIGATKATIEGAAASSVPSAAIDALMGHFVFAGDVEERLRWEAARDESVASSWWPEKTVRGRLNRIAAVADEYRLWRQGDEICMSFPWATRRLKSTRFTMCAPATGTAVDTSDPDGDAITIKFAIEGGCLTQVFRTWAGTRVNRMCPRDGRFISTVEVSSRFLGKPFVHMLTYARKVGDAK